MTKKEQSTMVRCLNPSCGMVMEKKQEKEHIKKVHPKFYKLMQESYKGGLTKHMKYDHLFEDLTEEDKEKALHS